MFFQFASIARYRGRVWELQYRPGTGITDSKITTREVFPLFLYHQITEAMVDVVRCVWRARVRAVCARVFKTSGSVVHKSTVW